MPLHNKNRIAYLGSLTLLFSYAEMLLPRFTPFFRLGLGNIAILLALNLSFGDFLLLTIIKAVTASLMAGTLFSPFFLISLGQSVVSGAAMFLLSKANTEKRPVLSVYGISAAGSAVSAVVQILLSSLYLGVGTFALLGPMLLFSLFSGILTAFCSRVFKIPEHTPHLERTLKSRKQPVVLLVILILAASAFIFVIKNLIVLAGCLIITLILQMISGRKIKILPHISLWIFVIIAALFVPNGKVIHSFGSFSITEGALLDGVSKALKLSAVSALSQCAASLRPTGDSLISLVLAYFTGLSNILRSAEGNLFQKLKTCLKATQLEE